MGITTKEISPELWSNAEACYLFDETALIENIKDMNRAFENVYSNFQPAYSFKTNYLRRICEKVKEHGWMAEVVSAEEYEYAKLIGFEREEIIFNGVTGDARKKFFAARKGSIVNADNYDELIRIVHLAEARQEEIELGIRVNFPISNGLVSRFGIDIDSADFKKAMVLLKTNRYVKFSGFHCHIGSARQTRFWVEKASQMAILGKKFDAKYIDLGGGMFGPMEVPLAMQFDWYEPSFDQYANPIGEVMNQYFPDGTCKLIVEPGTALVGNVLGMAATVTNILTQIPSIQMHHSWQNSQHGRNRQIRQRQPAMFFRLRSLMGREMML